MAHTDSPKPVVEHKGGDAPPRFLVDSVLLRLNLGRDAPRGNCIPLGCASTFVIRVKCYNERFDFLMQPTSRSERPEDSGEVER